MDALTELAKKDENVAGLFVCFEDIGSFSRGNAAVISTETLARSVAASNWPSQFRPGKPVISIRRLHFAMN